MGEYGVIIFRTIILYLLIAVIFRLMGKREIGELGIVDLVVFIMIAEMAATSIDNHNDNLFHSIVPILILVIVQVISSFISLKSRSFRRFVEGEPTLIIKNGNINEQAMRKQRYNFDDLFMQLREKDIRNLNDVEFAFLEPTGNLSVFKKDKKEKGYTVPVILDGKIQRDKLKELKISEEWLYKELAKKGHTDIKKISICGYNGGELFIDLIDEK